MLLSFSRTVVSLMAGVMFGLLACSSAQPAADTAEKGSAAAPLAAGWTRHSDPAGFSVDAPAGWNVATDRQFGRIQIAGKQGEQLTIWPMFVRDRQLDRNGAATVLGQLTQKIDKQLPWGKPAISTNMVRVTARGAQRNGVSLLLWHASASGTAICLYTIEASPAIYHASANTFAGIMSSFQIQQQTNRVAAPGGSPQTYAFVRWIDPRENAFSVNVPQGWKTVGGLYRLSATDVRPSLQLVSPDHQLWVLFNDAKIGAFIQPSPTLMRYGFREGSTYPLPDGSKMEVKKFYPGQQFAREYVAGAVKGQCSDLRVTSNNARQDLVPGFQAEFRAEGGPAANVQFTAGDVSFTCNMRGEGGNAAIPMKGNFVAATVSVSSGQSPLWYVYRLYGYLAPAERQPEAENVCQQAVKSFKYDPQWRAKQRQIDAATVQKDNQRSQQVRSQALAAIAADQRQTSEMISSSYTNRQKTYDEISRKRENAILGTVDVVDPNSHTQYKIDYNADYHWMSDQGYIAGTQTYNSPGAGWHEMIDLP